MILASDPDADRLGARVERGDGRYRLLTGSEIGAVLVDHLLAMHAERGPLCGHFVEGLHNVMFRGKEGQARSAGLMAKVCRDSSNSIGGIPVAFTDDYAVGTGEGHGVGRTYPSALNKANVIHFADEGFDMIRPPGTEPKLKL